MYTFLGAHCMCLRRVGIKRRMQLRNIRNISGNCHLDPEKTMRDNIKADSCEVGCEDGRWMEVIDVFNGGVRY